MNQLIEEPKNWGEYPVCRNEKYNTLCKRFCKVGDEPDESVKIWSNFKEFMIFAAMVGFTKNKKEALSKNNIKISFRTYTNTSDDGYIYLLSLIEKNDTNQLKDSGLKDVISTFEEYCNGGLSIIQTWIDEDPSDIDGIDTFYDKILEQLVKITPAKKNKKIEKPLF